MVPVAPYCRPHSGRQWRCSGHLCCCKPAQLGSSIRTDLCMFFIYNSESVQFCLILFFLPPLLALFAASVINFGNVPGLGTSWSLLSWSACADFLSSVLRSLLLVQTPWKDFQTVLALAASVTFLWIFRLSKKEPDSFQGGSSSFDPKNSHR